MELASILSPCLFWGKHNVVPFHFAVGKEVVNADKSPLHFHLWCPGAVEIKLWISRKELQAAIRGLNHGLGNGVLHALVPFPRWCMGIRSAQLCANGSSVTVLLAASVGVRLNVAPFWSTFHFTQSGTPPTPYRSVTGRLSSTAAMPPALCSAASLHLLRFAFSGTELVVLGKELVLNSSTQLHSLWWKLGQRPSISCQKTVGFFSGGR